MGLLRRVLGAAGDGRMDRALAAAIRSGRFLPAEVGAGARRYEIPLPSGGQSVLDVTPGFMRPTSATWRTEQVADTPTETALRTIRGVTDALRYDVAEYAPSRIGWRSTSDSRTKLYDALMQRMATEAGYSPTLLTHLRRAMGSDRRVYARNNRNSALPMAALPVASLWANEAE